MIMIPEQPYLHPWGYRIYTVKKQSRKLRDCYQSNCITFLFTLPYILQYYNQLPTKALFTFGLLCNFLLLRFTLIL